MFKGSSFFFLFHCQVVIKSVIHKLFFAEDESSLHEPDVAKIKNDLDSARANLREKDRDKSRLIEEKDRLEVSMSPIRLSHNPIPILVDSKAYMLQTNCVIRHFVKCLSDSEISQTALNLYVFMQRNKFYNNFPIILGIIHHWVNFN